MSVINEIKNTVNYWWIYLTMGILFLLGAFYVYAQPTGTYLTLSIFFAVFMLIDGISGIAFSLSNREQLQGWGWQLVSGIIATLIGLSLFMYPSLSAAILPIYVGFWVLLKGALITGVAFDLKSHRVENWGWILALGILNLIFAIMMIVNPLFGASMILLFTSISFTIVGLSLIVVSLWLRKIKRGVKRLKATAKEKLEDLRASVEQYINENPDDVQKALLNIRTKVDEALESQ